MLLRKSLRALSFAGNRNVTCCRYDVHRSIRLQAIEVHQHSSSSSRTLPRITPTTTSRPKTWKENMEDTFAFPEESVNRVLRKKSAIANIDEEQMKRTRDVLTKYGFPTGVIQECPDLLTLRSAALENYILIMQETGFTSIRPFLLPIYPAISKKSLATIRNSDLIPEKENVIENYFNILDLPGEIRSNILTDLPNNPNELSLMALRLLILQHFLAYKLESDVETCRKLIFKNPRTKHRSYAWISENLKVLLSECNFPPEKIVRNGTLLQGDPENSRLVLKTVDSLGGVPIKELVIRRPKILLVQASALHRTKELLKQHGIKEEAVAKYPELFTLSPDTVAARLKTVDETPELVPFKTHPRFCRILYYFEKVKKRLDYFSALDVSGVSLHILSLDQEKFSNYVQRGELRHKGGDLVNFLAVHLDLPRKDVRNALSVNPHWLQIPTLYAKEVLEFLQKSFTMDQLRITIPIVLYPLAKVKDAVELVASENPSQEGIKNHPYFLHLVLYQLEKDFHFTGDGIWTSYHQLRHDMTEKESHQNIP